jgi:TRAP-type mannitol/chloroaromatic compound transport system permease small subunit
MDPEIKKMLEDQQVKIDSMYQAIEKIRKYMLWSLIGSIVFFVLPLIVAVISIPFVLNKYISALSGLGL